MAKYLLYVFLKSEQWKIDFVLSSVEVLLVAIDQTVHVCHLIVEFCQPPLFEFLPLLCM